MFTPTKSNTRMSFVKNTSTKSPAGLSITTGFTSPKKANATFSDTPMNVLHHIDIVQRHHDETVDKLQEYKMDVIRLRNEIEFMQATLNNGGEEIERALTPFIEALIKEQTMAIDSQKEENLMLQSQISEIKKETSQLQMLILQANKKVANLEEEVGDYTGANKDTK